MKKIFFTALMMLAMVAMTSVSFTACGGDDDDNNENTNVGVHRIDVHFDDNAIGCRVISTFYGRYPDGSFSNLYENGKQLPTDATSHIWYSYDIRDMSITTDDGCRAEAAIINLTTPSMRKLDHDVTVTVVGYINGKRTKSQVFTLPAGHTTMSAGFDTGTTNMDKEEIL